MKKRLLAFLLAAAIIMGMLPTAAFAEENGTPTLQVSSEAENPDENSDTPESSEAKKESEPGEAEKETGKDPTDKSTEGKREDYTAEGSNTAIIPIKAVKAFSC